MSWNALGDHVDRNIFNVTATMNNIFTNNEISNDRKYRLRAKNEGIKQAENADWQN